MAQIFRVHPVNPQMRLLRQAADILLKDGVIVYPTDSSYALGCHPASKTALERIRRIRQTERDHEFTLVCRDLSEIATYARVDNAAYRLLRSMTPGPYTFVLRATGEVPKRLQDPKRRTIGIRVPDHGVALALLESLGEAIMSSTLLLPGDDLPLTETDDIEARLSRQVDAIVDGGTCGVEPTTVLDLTEGDINILRQGKGEVGVPGA